MKIKNHLNNKCILKVTIFFYEKNSFFFSNCNEGSNSVEHLKMNVYLKSFLKRIGLKFLLTHLSLNGLNGVGCNGITFHHFQSFFFPSNLGI